LAKRAATIGKVALGIVGVLVVLIIIGALVKTEEADDKSAAAEQPAAVLAKAALPEAEAVAPPPKPRIAAPPAAQSAAIPNPNATSTRRIHEADRYTALCLDAASRVACESGRDRIRALYAAAYGGDYQAQRNLAWSLQTASAPVLRNPGAACMWRLIIISSGSAQVDASDQANMQDACGRLSPGQLGEAKAAAIALTSRMVMGDAILDETSSTKGLDSTAEPL